jgi:ankyrin repeat protein
MAAYEGNTTVMKLLLAAKADVNAVSTSDGSEGLVLNCAICSGNIEAVRMLVNAGAIIHSVEYSPLQWAANLSDREVYDYLLKEGQAHLQPCDYGMALQGAAEYGNTEIFAELLEYEHEQHYVQDALNSAAEEEEWDIVRLVLNRPVLDKYKGLRFDELLVAVAIATEELEELLDIVWHYAKGSISQEAVNQALYEATDNEKKFTVRKLLSLGADANATGSTYVQCTPHMLARLTAFSRYGNALTAAAYDGNRDIVSMLLDAGAHVNSSSGWALQIAAGRGHLPVLELLLAMDADVNACTNDKRFPQGTALQAAVETGKLDIVTLLLSKRADPNLGSGPYVCPLLAAARKAEGPILEQLINSGAKVNVNGHTGLTSTPLNLAAVNLPVKFVKMLLEAGADVNHADVNGDTALILAAAGGNYESVKCLLAHGASVRAISNTGRNVLQAAVESGERECIDELIQHVFKILLDDTKDFKDTTAMADHGASRRDLKVGVGSNHGENSEHSEYTKNSDDTSITTKKWVEAKRNNYDGDDWGYYNQYDDYSTRQAQISPHPPYGYQPKFSQPGRNGLTPDDVHLSNTPVTNPSPPVFDQGGRSVRVSATCNPNHQNPLPQRQLYQQQQHGQQQYSTPPPELSLPLPRQYPSQGYSQQDQQQYGQQQQQQQQPPYGVPPPSLIPGYRPTPQVGNDAHFPPYRIPSD